LRGWGLANGFQKNSPSKNGRKNCGRYPRGIKASSECFLLSMPYLENYFTSYFPPKTNQEQAKAEQKITPQKSASPHP